MPNINRKGKKDCRNKERAGTQALKQPNVSLPQLRLKKKKHQNRREMNGNKKE